jgi:hypothetical protein
MAGDKLLVEEAQMVVGFNPVNLATAANPGDWVSLKNYRHVAVVFIGAPGAAAEPVTITMAQATAVAGTGTKALTFTTYYKKQAATDLTAVGTFTKVTQAAAATAILGVGSLGDNAALAVIEFNAEDLDVEGGFDCVQATVGDVGATSQLGTLLYILIGARYRPPLSAIVD